MSTLCEVRQEIRDVLNKYGVKLIVQHPEDISDEACWIEVRCENDGIIGSTALY